MRHLRVINHLGRKSAHRKAMLANMAASLIMNKRIATTEAKAKALRTYVEPLITKSKEDSTHMRRLVFSLLRDKVAVAELFRAVSPKIAERPGGYTRILKTGNRFGDNADMCIIELVDFNENMVAGGADDKGKTTRRRRAPKKKADEAAPKAVAAKPAAAKAAPVAAAAAEPVTDQVSVDEAEAAEKTVDETESPEPGKEV
jgi:large subunit ribosomal protein L17